MEIGTIVLSKIWGEEGIIRAKYRDHYLVSFGRGWGHHQRKDLIPLDDQVAITRYKDLKAQAEEAEALIDKLYQEQDRL